MQVSGHSAVVTGGASGLGAATASMLADAGAKVAVVDLNEEKANAHASAIGGIAKVLNVTDADAAEQTLKEIGDEIGVPRILVNCAGIGVAERIVNRDGPQVLDHFKRVIDINLNGTFNMMRLGAAAMMGLDELEEGARGVVINTASVAAYDGQVGQAAYAASKGAIASLTLPAAREFARFGIRVVTIAPGILETPMFDGVPDEAREGLLQITQFPARLGYPEEYAKLAMHIVDNDLLNAETIRLDGAVRLPPR